MEKNMEYEMTTRRFKELSLSYYIGETCTVYYIYIPSTLIATQCIMPSGPKAPNSPPQGSLQGLKV